jgi:hypothetical protein
MSRASNRWMIAQPRQDVTDNHRLRLLFLTLAERGMVQQVYRDPQTLAYLADLLTEFVYRQNMNRITTDEGRRLDTFAEMLAQSSSQMLPRTRRAHFKHIGDLALFYLGLFPEHLTYGRRLLSPEYYAAQGRRSYSIAADSEYDREAIVLRKLSDHFQECVATLNWVQAYIRDPFLQYMFREFDIT